MMITYADNLKMLTDRYNYTIRQLKHSYLQEKHQTGMFGGMGSSNLAERYSNRYNQLTASYRQEAQQMLSLQQRANPAWAKWRKLWVWCFVAGVLLAVTCCQCALPASETQAPVTNNTESVTYWNAENIPIPFLKDSTQYVSNPDHVLSPQAVQRMNGTLLELDKKLGVQSVVIVVNHIENDDPFRMAQDVGNRYGVGINNRGLMVVVGYEDRSINISPGRSLEADLTDVECHRLEQRFVVPAMKAQQPDTAMIYLTEGIYALLLKKPMPTLAVTEQEDISAEDLPVLLTMAFLTVWGLFFVRLNRKYVWIAALNNIGLIANPFHNGSGFYMGGFGGGHGGSDGFGGGGFSGGSFGGGSFGGGGATSRW